ncbi:HECT E3 ubiquitin ligase, partial [Thraustotheca clavata]
MELSDLSIDRINAIGLDSLEFLSSIGRTELIKLTMEKSCSESNKQPNDRVSADAARRQRVEELTRFFMEAKTDIEFALSGGLNRRERARQELIDADTKSDEEKSDASMQEINEDVKSNDDSGEMEHFQLLSDPIDARVFHPLLLSIRDSDPLLYGTILCHPLVAIHDPKRERHQKQIQSSKSKKKKHKSEAPTMYQPDFALPLLNPQETPVHLARFVARAIADGSIPALLIAAQLILSYPLDQQYPLASHLKVLRGDAEPGAVVKKNVKPPKKETAPNSEAVLDAAEFMSSVMELEGAMGPLAALRSRLGRLDDSMDEDMDAMSSSSQLPLEENVDEEALMARAIALSLSPELQLKDAEDMDVKEPAVLEEHQAKPVPVPFSPTELTAYAVFEVPTEMNVSGSVVLQYLWMGVNTACIKYVEQAETKRTVAQTNPITPNPLVFLLLQSILSHVSTSALQTIDASQDILVFTTGALVLLHALDVYFFHVHVMGIAPASVGLGQSLSHPNPLPLTLKAIVLQYLAIDTTEGKNSDLNPIVFEDASVSLLDSIHRYQACIPAQARMTWARGLAHFYPLHSERHELLQSMLTTPSNAEQLDLLCTRLSMPDLSTGFVPMLHEEISTKESGPERTNLVDDSALLASKLCIWSPTLLRDSLEAKTCHPLSVMEFLQSVAPNLVEPSSSDLSIDNVVNLYAQAHDTHFSDLKQTWSHLLPTMERLTHYVESHEAAATVPFQSPTFCHLSTNTFGMTYTPRLQLLRALQDCLLSSLHGSIVGEEPTRLEFDSARCADTLTLVDNHTSAKQHTAKQWGMVLSTYGCAPNTGLHEWAVRLDRCEKGHVFLGVSTREASVATYVGGDRHGWGLIGTRALWHNRSKVRGDYGDGFSTGSVVRIRLNTDTGALSFGLLDDDSDWGVAFDGLTQHGTLYPAIGLYQRDDQVTIVPVLPAGIAATSIRTAPSENTITPLYQEVVLNTFFQYVSSISHASDELLIALGLPLYSTLCLMARQSQRNVKHALPTIFAMHLLPICLEVAQRLDDGMNLDTESRQPILSLNIAGKWELKSMAAGTIPAQQYILDLEQSDSSIRGHSASSSVAVDGTIQGTRVSFTETWTQGGTCTVQGRLRIDGRAFIGSYEDTRSHTVGVISGTALSASISTTLNLPMVLQMVVGTLIGAYNTVLLTSDPDYHVYSSINNGADIDDSSTETSENPLSPEATNEEYEEWVRSPLFSGGLPEILPHVAVLAQRYSVPASKWSQAVTPSLTPCAMDSQTFLSDLIAGRNEMDAHITKHAGESPFLRLGGEAMKTARRMICACMLWHTGISIELNEDDRPHENVLHIWRAAQRVVEWSIRMKQLHSHSYQDMATYLTHRARFLLQLHNPLAVACPTSERVFSETLMHVSRFLQATGMQLGKLNQLLLRNARRAYFRAMGLHSMRHVLELGLMRSSSALCHVLQWLHGDPLKEKGSPKTTIQHYDHDIHGCGRVLYVCVKEAWEALYAHLASTLSRATWAKDSDLQLVVLQAWGILITPDDHSFVSRVGIFRILQTVLDEARSSAVVPKHIVNAALKVVHLLAAQVATGSLTEETS